MLNPWTMAAAGIAAAAIFGLGFRTGGAVESASCNKKLVQEIKAADEVVKQITRERDQARSAVEAANATIAEQRAQVQAYIEEDLEARELARQAAARRDLEAQRQRQEVADSLKDLQLRISNETFGTCASERVNPDLIRVLNDGLNRTSD